MGPFITNVCVSEGKKYQFFGKFCERLEQLKTRNSDQKMTPVGYQTKTIRQ